MALTRKKLSDLGLWLGPASVAGLLANLIGLSPHNCAGVALTSLITTALFTNRLCLNKLIPSHLLLSVGLWIAVVSAYVGQKAFPEGTSGIIARLQLLHETGLIKYSPKGNDLLSEIRNEIEKAKREIFLIGITFHKTAPDWKIDLERALERKVNVRILMFDVLSDQRQNLVDSFGSRASLSGLLTQAEVTLVHLKQVYDKWKEKNATNSFEIKLFKSELHMRMYIFDREKVGGKTYFIPYANKLHSSGLPGYLALNGTNGVADKYGKSAEELWRDTDTEPLEKWWPKYQAAKKKR